MISRSEIEIICVQTAPCRRVEASQDFVTLKVFMFNTEIWFVVSMDSSHCYKLAVQYRIKEQPIENCSCPENWTKFEIVPVK